MPAIPTPRGGHISSAALSDGGEVETGNSPEEGETGALADTEAVEGLSAGITPGGDKVDLGTAVSPPPSPDA